MIRNFLERSPRLRNMFHRSPRQSVPELPVLPNTVHFSFFFQMNTPEADVNAIDSNNKTLYKVARREEIAQLFLVHDFVN